MSAEPAVVVCLRCGYQPTADELEEQGEGLCPACGRPLADLRPIPPAPARARARPVPTQRRPIAVSFTLAEAKALRYAAGNTVDHGDALASLFPTSGERRAALRAYQRLEDALRPHLVRSLAQRRRHRS